MHTVDIAQPGPYAALVRTVLQYADLDAADEIAALRVHQAPDGSYRGTVTFEDGGRLRFRVVGPLDAVTLATFQAKVRH